jgi:hypothetical protein
VGKWPFGAVLACVLVAAGPRRLQAQDALSTAPAETVGAQAAPAPGALPTWPPDSGGLLGMFHEDLSKPLTPKRKFGRAMKQSLFPGLVGSAGAAGFGMALNTRADRDYGMGGRGFVRRWGSAFGQNAVGTVVGDFALASMLHQDPRYHPDMRKGIGHRLGHALASVAVTQSDSGASEFNSSHLLGIVIATGAATAWHHTSDRTAGVFGRRFGYDVASSAIYHVVAEFLFYRKEPRK